MDELAISYARCKQQQLDAYLRDLGACDAEREAAVAWTAGRSLQECWSACENLDWLRWLVVALAEAEYERVTVPARAARDRVTAPAWAEYERATTNRAAALTKYLRATAHERAAYACVTDTAEVECDRVTARAWACCTCDELRAKFSCPKGPVPLWL